jgi:hypothetical protein
MPKEAFDVVRGYQPSALAASVFLAGVVHGGVDRELLADLDVQVAFVGVQSRLAIGVAHQRVADVLTGHLWHGERAGRVTTLHQGKNRAFFPIIRFI